MSTAAAPPTVPDAPPTVSPLARGTLGRQLITRVIALVTVVSVAMSALSLIVVGLTMLRTLDRDVAADAARDFTTTRTGAGAHFGKSAGTISVTVMPNGSYQAVYVDRSTGSDIDPADIAVLLNLPRDNAFHIVHLPHYGTYRVYAGTAAPVLGESPDEPQPPVAQPSAPGTRNPPAAVVTGMPLGNLESQLGSMALAELGLTVLAIGLAILAMRVVVRRALRPLNELAGTALAVSTMELEKGAVDLDRRAEVDQSKPNNEVVRVGNAFNLMLDHVGEALNAREANESKVRKFVADASHELRNPLAAIRGYAEITRRQSDELPTDAAFAIERIGAESERMSSLVEDMLLLARLDNRRGLEMTDVDLTEQLIHAVSDARVAGPDHVWNLELPDEPLIVRGDEHRLYQVVVNLLTNARVHTPAGTRVVTGLTRRDDTARITVTDNGPGIAPELQGKLFDRFVRADASRARQASSSTGLGLAIVRSVVEGHGGHVFVDSVPGRTAFVIDLPIAGPSERTQETYKGA